MRTRRGVLLVIKGPAIELESVCCAQGSPLLQRVHYWIATELKAYAALRDAPALHRARYWIATELEGVCCAQEFPVIA